MLGQKGSILVKKFFLGFSLYGRGDCRDLCFAANMTSPGQDSRTANQVSSFDKHNLELGNSQNSCVWSVDDSSD